MNSQIPGSKVVIRLKVQTGSSTLVTITFTSDKIGDVPR